MPKPILVVKFGTASITKQNGEPEERIIFEIARQLATLHDNYRIVIISSGAVGAGKHFIKDYHGTINQRKAAAAVGNPLLLAIYSKYFAAYGISVGQSLCERRHFANREQFLQLKNTYEELWKNGIIPIANENDVVSDRELKFSDNDELATLIATGFGAETMLICTQSGGLLNREKQIINEVSEINDEILQLVDSSKSSLGTGGMASKLTFTKLATRMGIRVIIFGMNQPEGLLKALSGERGSTFLPHAVNLSARNKWLGSGGLTAGNITIDEGAKKAVLNRNSLLAVGILYAEGEFESGEIIELKDENGAIFAVARTRCSSADIPLRDKIQGFVIAHANDIVVI